MNGAAPNDGDPFADAIVTVCPEGTPEVAVPPPPAPMAPAGVPWGAELVELLARNPLPVSHMVRRPRAETVSPLEREDLLLPSVW